MNALGVVWVGFLMMQCEPLFFFYQFTTMEHKELLNDEYFTIIAAGCFSGAC